MGCSLQILIPSIHTQSMLVARFPLPFPYTDGGDLFFCHICLCPHTVPSLSCGNSRTLLTAMIKHLIRLMLPRHPKRLIKTMMDPVASSILEMESIKDFPPVDTNTKCIYILKLLHICSRAKNIPVVSFHSS